MPSFPTRSEVLNASISDIRSIMATHRDTLQTILNALHSDPDTITRNELAYSFDTLNNLCLINDAKTYPSLLHARFAPSLTYTCDHSASEGSQIVIHHNKREAGRLQFDPNDLVHPVMRSHLFALFIHLVPGF